MNWVLKGISYTGIWVRHWYMAQALRYGSDPGGGSDMGRAHTLRDGSWMLIYCRDVLDTGGWFRH